jgi:hypothetical protein
MQVKSGSTGRHSGERGFSLVGYAAGLRQQFYCDKPVCGSSLKMRALAKRGHCIQHPTVMETCPGEISVSIDYPRW